MKGDTVVKKYVLNFRGGFFCLCQRNLPVLWKRRLGNKLGFGGEKFSYVKSFIILMEWTNILSTKLCWWKGLSIRHNFMGYNFWEINCSTFLLLYE